MGDNLVKHFNVIMAGFIGGTVALFTSVLGVSGTIIGSVLSSFLYQLLSGYSEEKIEEGALRKPKLANEIVYIFPLVVIGIIELIFLLSALHYRFDMIFDFLESAVANNLFRLMGIGLIILGAYPYFNSNNALSLKIDGKEIGIYKYNINVPKQRERLETIHDNRCVYVEGMKYPVLVNGTFMLLGYEVNPQRDRIIELFESFPN